MKLYSVHCGFYDQDLFEGVYESHVNFYVVAENFEEARVQAKLHPDYMRKHMHVDGLQEIISVNGWKVVLEKDGEGDKTSIVSSRHRDLAPKKTLS